MRIAATIAAFALVASAAHAGDAAKPAAKPLKMTLTWTQSESSMDSNSTTDVFVVDGDTISHAWDYSGYHPDAKFVRHKDVKAKLKDAAAVQKALSSPDLAKAADVKLAPDPAQMSIPERTTTTVHLVVEDANGKREINVVSSSPDKKVNVLDALKALRDVLAAQAPFKD